MSRFAASSIVAITFGILLAFILIATSYLFCYRWRGMDSRTIFPFPRSEYHPLAYPSQGQPPTVDGSMQSSSSGWPITAVQSPNSINPEVSNTLIANVSLPLNNIAEITNYLSYVFLGIIYSRQLSPPTFQIGNTDQT